MEARRVVPRGQVLVAHAQRQAQEGKRHVWSSIVRIGARRARRVARWWYCGVCLATPDARGHYKYL